jgi:hypothetical protein
LLAALADAHHIGERPYFLIGHSLGGLLIKQMIRHSMTMNDQYSRFADHLSGVIFFSTPHTGAGIASLTKYLKIIRATDLAEELTKNRASLRELDDWFRNYAVDKRLAALSFYEKRDTKGVRVVDETSGDPHLPGVTAIPVDADHVTICKFRDVHSPVYLQVRQFLEMHIQSGAGKPATVPAQFHRAEPDSSSGPSRHDVWVDTTATGEGTSEAPTVSADARASQAGMREACGLAAQWLSSALLNQRVYLSRFQFRSSPTECTAEAFQLGMSDRARVSVSVVHQHNDTYAVTVDVASVTRGVLLTRTAQIASQRFNQAAVISFVQDLWPELTQSLEYLRSM